MKKYLILQAKKSMSLFLAVLMLLSCWVWVAPQEAKVEAADITPVTQYTVTVGWTVTTRNATGGSVQYKTVSDGGWGTESSLQTAESSFGSNRPDLLTIGQHTFEFTTTEFPTNIILKTVNGKNGTVNDGKTTVDYVQINGVTVYHGGETWSGENSANIYPTYNDGGNFGTTGMTKSDGYTGTFTWPRPMIAGFRNTSATQKTPEINISLNKVGQANVEGSTNYDISKYECYDQYGVAIPDAAAYLNAGKIAKITSTTTYVSDSNNSDDPTEYAADIWSKGNEDQTVVVSPNLQISNPQGSNGKDTFYLVRKYVVENVPESTIVSKVSAKVNVTYPKYTVNFNAGLSHAQIPYNGEGSPATGTYSPSAYNGGTIAVPDNKSTTASGYTFYGYWSKPQPASGDASYNALTSSFAQPCTTEDYTAYKSASGSTVSGDIVTDADGNRWYDAGVAMDPSTVKTIDVSENYKNFTENWYGWWLSKDLSVKFYDVDGAFFGEETVKAGQTHGAIEWPVSKYTTYTSGAFTFTVDPNLWEDINGDAVDKRTGTFTKDLILTPKLTRTDFTGTYKVNFIDPYNGNNLVVGTQGGIYDYRQNIANDANSAQTVIAQRAPAEFADDMDLQYSYELLGWSSVEPTTGKNYHVLLEDADFDTNGTAIGINKDWVVRNEATYYAVYRRHTKTYVVNFNYKDATGSNATRQLKVKYGEDLVPPTDYVPYTYVTKGFGYTFDKWTYNNGNKTLNYAATIPFTSENVSLRETALDDGKDVTPIAIDATYGTPVATPYTVTFNYVDDEGEDVANSVQVRNEQYILPTTVDSLTPAEKWDHDDNLYTYADKWEITDGAATVGVNGAEKKVGDIVDTAELTSLTPTSNITFKAVYTNPVPFYTVTYIDGDKTYTDRVLQDTNVPEWTYKATNDNGTPDDASDDFEEDKIYVPADYEGEGGMYEFQGWYDKETGGNKITAADKVTSNLTLYSQFKFVPDTFLIRFMNHDGTVQLGAGEYEKGQNIEALVTTATKAAQSRAADNVYEYLFLGWDKAVPTFCEGYDVTYTALYKPVYKYYDVKWYNSDAVKDTEGKVIGWAANKDFTTDAEGNKNETNLLATTHHTYNSKLYTPSVDNLNCLETAPEGQNYVFAGWYYNDAEGNAVKYERGMTITAEMEFYATYTLTAKVHTVTTVVKGETAKYEVADGHTAVIPDPQAGYVDETKHDAFAGWYTDDQFTDEFDSDAAITADTKIYAKFTEGEHDFSEKELVDAPTYYAEGSMDVWCACDKAKTKKTESIDVLTDTEIPTGTIYLGGLGQWSSTDEIGGAALDNGEITIYANANTDVIVTANDTGDVNALYNPAGIGKGIKLIRAFIYPGKFETLTADSYGAAQSLTVDVYNDDTQEATNNANFAVKLGDFVVADLDEDGKPQYDENNNVKYKDLVSGESYIIYYYVVDKAGNQLRQKVRTAKFIYDDTAPAFTVEGESNNAAVPTYCGEATVTGLEEGVTLTVNGETVAVADGKYTIAYEEGMDNVIITATDKAGNTYSKKIKVAEHSYLLTKQEASCGIAGYEKEVCIICGDVKTDKTYPALVHIWSGREVIPADCVNNGIVVVTCEICGDKVETEFEEDGVTPVIPALGHEFAVDENDEIVYTTVTESTCKTAGLGEAYCTECNGELEGGYITKELELNKDNHEDITETEVAADCIHNGYYTKACSCGVIIEHKDHVTDPDIYEAKGHGATVWEVIKEANCYQAGTMVGKCEVCTAIVVEETAYGYTENADGDFTYVLDEDGNKVVVDGKYQYYLVPATGEHVKVVANPDTYKTEGVVKYKCAEEGCPHKYEDKVLEDETLEEYTVIFLAEDGKTELLKKTVVEGTYLKKDDATAPEKDDTVEYDYTFAGWAVDGKTVKFPYEVTKAVTLTATYKQTKIKYTHNFYVPTTIEIAAAEGNADKELYATLVGTYGDERVPSGTPVFKHKDADTDAALKKLYTFEFKGWKNSEGVIVTDFTVSDDADFIAVFEAKALKYKVTYYNGTDFVWQTEVSGGESVTYAKKNDKGEIILPEKAFDDDYHYAFDAWYTDNTLKTEYTGGAITADTRLYAGFTAEAHKDYVVNTKVGSVVEGSDPEVKDGIIQKADCDLPELTEYICACGHTKVEQTQKALGHKMGEYVYDEESGKMVSECERCDYTDSYNASFTVKFVNEDGSVLAALTVQANKEATYDFEKYGTPSKDADAENTYVFAGWLDADGNKLIKDIIFKDVTADATYTAYYTATVRKYNVTYVDVNNKTLQTAEVTYGGKVPEYNGTAPVKAYDDFNHYTFDKWSVAAGTTVEGDVLIRPVFTATKHDFDKEEIKQATCTENGGKHKICSACGYSYASTDIVPMLPHEWVETGRTEPDHNNGVDGKISYKCKNCTATKEEVIPAESTHIKLTVVDTNGNPVNGAVVKFYDSNLVPVAEVTTQANGVAEFIGPKGEYTYSVVFEGKEVVSNQPAKDGAANTPGIKTEEDCSCSCHRQNFWGILFRLLHKFIKIFTKKISCCSCPDPAYFN